MASKRQKLDFFRACTKCGQLVNPNCANDEGICKKCLSKRFTLASLCQEGAISIDGSFNNSTVTSGELSWKIDHFHELLGECNITRVRSLRSKSFFTSQYGYKLQVQLDVFHNVLKNRQDIFIRPVILKGPNDAVNAWPFKEKITFTFINQYNHKTIWRITFRPDPNSTCFKKPSAEMNVASEGIVFPDVDQLYNQGFIKDDTLILHSKCQTSDVPVPTREALSLSCEASE